MGLVGALVAAPILIRGLRLRVTLASGLAVALAAMLVVVVAPPALAHRMRAFSDGGTGRSDLWRVAVRITEDHPMLGVGAGNFPVVAPRYAQTVSVSRPDLVYTDPHVVHNTYLQFFVETGVGGGALFLVLVVGAIRRARIAGAVSRTDRDGLLVRAALVATLGYLISLFFISGAHEKPLWVLLALCLRLPNLVAVHSEDGAA